MPSTKDASGPGDAANVHVNEPPVPEGAALRRSLGVGSIVFMVVAAAAPLASVVANIPTIIATSGTTSAPLYFIAAGLILLVFSVGFVQMSKHVRNAGAFYSYIQTGLGRIPGVGAATLALASYLLALVAGSCFLGVITANAVTNYFDAQTPWWAWTFAWLALIGLVGYRDIDLSAKVLGVVLVGETIAVIVLDIAIIARGGDAGITMAPFDMTGLMLATPALGLMNAFFGFIGFEATAVFRSEAKDPDRTIPRATYIAVISIGVFYAISAFCVVIGMGVDKSMAAAEADRANFVLNLVTSYVGPIFYDIVQVLLLSSFFATLLTFHNVLSRYQFTLAGVGVMPRWLFHVNPKHRAPSRSSLVISAVSAGLLIILIALGLSPIDQIYTWMSGASTLGIVALMAATSVAVVVSFRRRGDTNYLQTLVAPAVAALALGALFVTVIINFSALVGGDTAATIILGLMALTVIAGLVTAVVLRKNRPEVYQGLIRDSGD